MFETQFENRSANDVHRNTAAFALAGINTLDPTVGDQQLLQQGDIIISPDGNRPLKIYRPLPEGLQRALDSSILPFVQAEAYMHYMQAGIQEDRNDPEYQNQAIFFWEATEAFPQKSLPPQFESFPKKYFWISDEREEFQLAKGEVVPWFGQPGGGTKHYITKADEMILLSEAAAEGLIEYFTFVEPLTESPAILDDRDQYYFLTNGKILGFRDGWPVVNGNHISISMAYACGLFDLVRRVR
jgi:hypothetical protein